MRGYTCVAVLPASPDPMRSNPDRAIGITKQADASSLTQMRGGTAILRTPNDLITISNESRCERRVSATTDSPSAAGDNAEESTVRKGAAPLTLVLLCVGLAVTGLLTWVTYSTNLHNETRLLRLQARQAATILTGTVPTIQTPLASAVEIAGATGGNPAKFDAFMQSYVGPTSRSSRPLSGKRTLGP